MARRTSDSSGPSAVAGDALEGTPYRALRALGRGGMGEVIEAEHLALRKRVVVKLVRRAFAHDPRFADRLRVEAQALAAVSSPHVVAVLDLGQTPAGRPYFVMERLEGRTLGEELGRRGAARCRWPRRSMWCGRCWPACRRRTGPGSFTAT
ncbi:protein kinase domain-containing protein [Sorangium sp. So ce233]|uniref:protein kinase domain-containing protein n=1 Tax=Sorangium sp. So ce233 TaxID=3133290 RepID=UPI003F5DE008